MKNDWLLVAASLALSLLLLTAGRGLSDAPAPVEVTVVPGDLQALGCAGQAGGASCAFDRDGNAVAVDRPLRPFVTKGGRTVVLRGLFEQEAVRAWLAAPKAPDQRVRVRCDARRLALDARLGVRFAAGDPFAPARVDVADVSECAVR